MLRARTSLQGVVAVVIIMMIIIIVTIIVIVIVVVIVIIVVVVVIIIIAVAVAVVVVAAALAAVVAVAAANGENKHACLHVRGFCKASACNLHCSASSATALPQVGWLRSMGISQYSIP